jgi:hypothetical protein
MSMPTAVLDTRTLLAKMPGPARVVAGKRVVQSRSPLAPLATIITPNAMLSTASSSPSRLKKMTAVKCRQTRHKRIKDAFMVVKHVVQQVFDDMRIDNAKPLYHVIQVGDEEFRISNDAMDVDGQSEVH